MLWAKDFVMLPFTYAVIDDDGEVLRKYRWNAKEAKWHKEQGSNVIKLEVVKEKPFDINNYEECLFWLLNNRNKPYANLSYGNKENLNEYLLQNLEGSSKLIRGMLIEFQTASPQRRQSLTLELDSAVLGWVETWNALQ